MIKAETLMFIASASGALAGIWLEEFQSVVTSGMYGECPCQREGQGLAAGSNVRLPITLSGLTGDKKSRE